MSYVTQSADDVDFLWQTYMVRLELGHEVSYLTQITDDIDFVWQAQYLVRLEGDFTCSAHWK